MEDVIRITTNAFMLGSALGIASARKDTNLTMMTLDAALFGIVWIQITGNDFFL